MHSPKPGDILYLREPDRSGKLRPAVVVSHQRVNGGSDVTVVPLTSQPSDAKYNAQRVFVPKSLSNGLDRDSWAKCRNIATTVQSDFDLKPIGRVTDEELKQIYRSIAWCLSDSLQLID